MPGAFAGLVVTRARLIPKRCGSSIIVLQCESDAAGGPRLNHEPAQVGAPPRTLFVRGDHGCIRVALDGSLSVANRAHPRALRHSDRRPAVGAGSRA